MLTSDTFTALRKSVLGRKLLFSILLFSTIVTLFLTSFQIYLDYRKGMESIYDRIEQIRLTQLESLTQNLWDINTDQIKIQLKGLLEIKSITNLKIISTDNENISISKNTIVTDPIITRMPLIYRNKSRSQEIDLGTLEITNDTSQILKDLQSKIFIILLTQAMKTFLVSLFILYIYNRLVNRHIIEIGIFARKLSLENIGKKLELQRGENEEHDELDKLADAFNVMQEKFAKEIEQKNEIQRQLRQSQKMEALGTLSSGIAHDFNNILQGLYNALFLLEEELIDNADALAKLDTANELTDRARELVKQILIFTRQEEASFDKFAPVAPIKDVVDILRAASNNKVAIDFIVDPPEGRIFGDKTQLKQVILNIGNNAIQAVEGRANPKVIIKVTPTTIKNHSSQNLGLETYLKIEVIDNGHGITKDILDRVFEPFFTTKEVGKGTGLGLSVVHGIIERHNGEIKIHSTPGKSTRICVHLPLFPNAIKGESRDYIGDEKVYLIAAKSNTASQYKKALEHIKHSTQAFTRADVFIEKFKQDLKNTKLEQFSLIIIDQDSGEQTPEEIIRRVRQFTKVVPILLLVKRSEDIASIPFNLRVAQLQKSKEFQSQKSDEMSLILLTRELKYGMNMALKTLSS